MIRIKYETWKKTCELIKEYSTKYGKFYLQLYPIKFCNNYEVIITEKYFKSNILNGKFLMEDNNYTVCENYEMKDDGTFRNKTLIPPILYIYYTAIVMEISNKYVEKRNSNISVRYAGNYKKGRLHYRQEYYEFINELEENSFLYDTFIKIDIKDFYENIDINKMTNLLKDSISMNEKEQMVFKEFITFIGNKKFPQIDGGIASSYLATIVYLDIIDNRYYKVLQKIFGKNSFKMTRYADDLYIFFDKNNYVLKKLENKLTYEYSNLIHEYSLNLNMKKTHLKPSCEIYQDINSISLEDEAILEKELDDDFKKESLEKFFKDLIERTKDEGINYKSYYDIIDECFENPEIRFYQRQIYSTIVFKELEWFKQTETYCDLIEIIRNNNDILVHDPKRLLSALLNMHSGELIKRFLYNLYMKDEKHQWTVYDSFLSMRYLLYRNFKCTKLLSILEREDFKFYTYIEQYINGDWVDLIVKSNLPNMNIYDKALEESIIFIRFLSIIECNKQNFLTYQAYMKSFFDSVTLNLFYKKQNKKKKYFEKRQILDFYNNNYNISNSEYSIIERFCDSRNENPLCHSNIKIIKNKNMKKKIEEESKEIMKILENNCNK